MKNLEGDVLLLRTMPYLASSAFVGGFVLIYLSLGKAPPR